MTGIGFQSLNLNQTVSHICGNFSNMFVAEFAVIVSANRFDTVLEGLLIYSYTVRVSHNGG